MIYFCSPNPAAKELVAKGLVGFISSPRSSDIIKPGITWCADNACFGGRYQGDRWYLNWLMRQRRIRQWCKFVTAPDVVGNARATLVRSLPMLGRIRGLGFPVAFVAQDGAENIEMPWDEFDVLFLGGTTEFKLGHVARRLTKQALELDKPVHMGRVNTLKRMRYASSIGCASVDGTHLAFNPTEGVDEFSRWLPQLRVKQHGLRICR